MRWLDSWLGKCNKHEESCCKLRDEEFQQLKEDYDELKATFSLIWDAQQRAAQMWQEKTGQNFSWPDKASLIVWLMEENGCLREQVQSLLEDKSK